MSSKSASHSVCWEFTRSGICPRGNACKWEHPILQSGGLPDESQFCWNYQRTGRCPRGAHCQWIHELVLLPWPSPSTAPLTPTFETDASFSIPTTPEGYWDQFDENARLFGTTSSFDPSMAAYTTPLALDALTQEQIKQAEMLSCICLPSAKLNSAVCCYCSSDFCTTNSLIEHVKGGILNLLKQQGEECSGLKGLKSFLKRKSWIVVQESLPAGLVSEIESLYDRQVTSSTNLFMIAEAVDSSETCGENSKNRLLSEVAAIAAYSANQIKAKSYRIFLKRLQLVDLDPAVFQGTLIVSFHSLETETSDIKEIIGVTPELPVVNNSAEYELLYLETDILKFALVVHSMLSGPVGFSKIAVDVSMWSSSVQAPIVTEIPTFIKPGVSVDVTVQVETLIIFSARNLVIDRGEKFGGVLSAGGLISCKLEIRLIEDFKVVQSFLSQPLHPVLRRDLFVLHNESVSLARFLSRKDLESLKIEIYLIGENSTSLIDSLPLKAVELDSPVLIGGSTPKGELCITPKTIEEGKKKSLFSSNHLSDFFRSKNLEKCSNRRFHVMIAGLPESLFGGQARYAIKGYGYETCYDSSTLSQLDLGDSGSVDFEISALISHDSVPVLGIVLFGATTKTYAVYSVPLLNEVHSFGPISVKIEKINEENIETLFLPPVRRIPQTYNNKTVRLFCSIESLVKYPRELKSVFVTLRSVKMSVCPLMVPSSDVLSLQFDDDLFLLGSSSASTVSRSNTSRPTWQHDVQLDIAQWSGDDWLMFLIYENDDEGTRLAGQACLSQSFWGEGPFTLPVTEGDTPAIIQGCFLRVSCLKPLEVWAPIYLTQSGKQRLKTEGELRITLRVLRDTDCKNVLKENHVWLPIKAIYPLIVANCPPRGFLTVSLSRLNGTVVAETYHKFSMLDTVLSCGGLNFNFSRAA